MTPSTSYRGQALQFPDGFLWGASTAAFPMEGAPDADGSGLSVQHTFARTPGNHPGVSALDQGVDHYRRWREDVDLARELEMGSLRFSIPWARILPEGTGTPNIAALDHYQALVDALLESGITPIPYLYLWDLPVALQDRGGWANRDSASWFADYASVSFDRLGDRIDHWFTVCEPWSVVHFGHLVGEEAPGLRDLRTALRAGHHLLLGHGRAVEAFRASDARGGIGLSTVKTHIEAATDAPEDTAAVTRTDQYFNRLFLDPVLLGAYPEDPPPLIGAAWPTVEHGDLRTIATPIDFLGIVYYLSMTVADATRSADEALECSTGGESELAGLGPAQLASMERNEAVFAELLDVRVVDQPVPTTALGWPIAPDGLLSVLLSTQSRYGDIPLYVAENGAAFTDMPASDGTIADTERRDYIREHLYAAHEAISMGVDLRGWSVWSLLDDHTWNFGLIRVDPETRDRTIKASGEWYRDVIVQNRVPRD